MFSHGLTIKRDFSDGRVHKRPVFHPVNAWYSIDANLLNELWPLQVHLYLMISKFLQV